MNWLSGALAILGAGVALAGAVFALSRFIGMRGRVVADHRRIWYVDLLSRMVLVRDGISRHCGGDRQIRCSATCCSTTFGCWRVANVTTCCS